MEQINSLADLLDLQDVDLQIDRLLHERESVPELAPYRQTHATVSLLVKEKEQLEAEIREANLELDKASGELELAEQKLAAEQNRLYAGGLSARDAEYLRQEVEMLTRKNREMEDGILVVMERREDQDRRLAELDGALDAARREERRLEGLIAEQWKRIDAELAKRETRKADIVPLIPGDLLQLYDDLRDRKQGVAVGRLAEGICGGCHLRLSAAEQVEVKRGDPPRCLHCERILVV